MPQTPQTPKPEKASKAPKTALAPKTAKTPSPFKAYQTPQCPPPALSVELFSDLGDGTSQWKVNLGLHTGFDKADYGSNFEYVLTGVYDSGGTGTFFSPPPIALSSASAIFIVENAATWTVSAVVQNTADSFLDSASRAVRMRFATLTKTIPASVDIIFAGTGSNGVLALNHDAIPLNISFGLSTGDVWIGTSDEGGVSNYDGGACANNLVSFINGLGITGLSASINTVISSAAAHIQYAGGASWVTPAGDADFASVAAVTNVVSAVGTSVVNFQSGVEGKTHFIDYAAFSILGADGWTNDIEIGYFDSVFYPYWFATAGTLLGDASGLFPSAVDGATAITGASLYGRVSLAGSLDTGATEPTGSDAKLRVAFTTE